MCGIIGYIGPHAPQTILLEGLTRLEYRGYDSAGIAVMNGKDVAVYRSEGRIQALEQKLPSSPIAGTVGIGHTRWATHGAPNETNAHPHKVGHITLVHNGIIENYADHKETLLKMGRSIVSETDSEIVAHLLDIAVESGLNLEDAILSVLPKLRGSYAFVLMSDKEPELIAGIRNGAPLLVGLGDHEHFIASDVQAILHRTNRVVYLNDGEFALCQRSGIHVKSFDNKPITPEVKTLDWTPDQMDKLGYRHYMLKEIHEQPQAVANTIQGNVDPQTGLISLQGLGALKYRLNSFKKVYLVACGTARHAALVGKYYLEQFGRIDVEVDFASEFRYRNPILDENTLLVLISQSGETADTLAALREGKNRGITALSICNVRESTLARESDAVLYTNAGPEIGVASTKAFTTQLTMLYMLAAELGYARNQLKKREIQALTEDLRKLPHLLDRTLQVEKQVESLALEHQSDTFFFYMARGVNYPIALEGALKLKEISYLLAEGYPGGELKHGPIALVDRRTVIVSLSPLDRKNDVASLYEKQMSNLQEVKARGGKILSIGTEGDSKTALQSRFFVGVPDAPWALNPILLSIPMQLLAYYMALFRGTDVDKPRNLAKSVTVE